MDPTFPPDPALHAYLATREVPDLRRLHRALDVHGYATTADEYRVSLEAYAREMPLTVAQAQALLGQPPSAQTWIASITISVDVQAFDRETRQQFRQALRALPKVGNVFGPWVGQHVVTVTFKDTRDWHPDYLRKQVEEVAQQFLKEESGA